MLGAFFAMLLFPLFRHKVPNFRNTSQQNKVLLQLLTLDHFSHSHDCSFACSRTSKSTHMIQETGRKGPMRYKQASTAGG